MSTVTIKQSFARGLLVAFPCSDNRFCQPLSLGVGMPIVLSCVNLKGGVGKTAIAVNFAAFCGREGLKTLLVDLDPQTNATFSCISVDEWQDHAAKYGTVAHLLGVRGYTSAEGQTRDPKSIIRKGVFEKVDLVPSHLDLFMIDLDMASATARETRLRRALAPVMGDYDIIICDCPPNLTIPTQNALAMSSHFAVPVSPDFLSVLGVQLLLTRVQRLSDELELKLALGGVIVSRIGRPAYHRDQTVATLRQAFKDQILDSEIHERVAISECAQSHKPIFASADGSAIQEFSDMSRELMKRIGLKQ